VAFVKEQCNIVMRSKHGNKYGNPKHGDCKGGRSREYMSWQGMKTRCLNKNNPNYPYYGGRGVTICEKWTGRFEEFLKDMGRCPKGLTLDRIDPYGNYEPTNCRWASRSVQSSNRRLRTHCSKGHKFTPENTYVYRDGRCCRECRRIACRL